MFGSKKLLKAIAMLLLIRKRTNCKNRFSKFKYNHLVEITGMHPNTIKERMHTLVEYGIAIFNGETLVLRSITSKHVNRNIKLGKFNYGNVKSVEISLRSLLIVIIQNRKNFCKRAIRNAHNGRNAKRIKSARKVSRKYGFGNEYVEKGLSYKTIARKLGVCVKTAVETVKFGVKMRFFKKEKHCISYFMPFVNYRDVYGYTFTTKNYGYIIQPNTYEVSSVWW